MSGRWVPKQQLALVAFIQGQSGSEIRSFFVAYGLGTALPHPSLKPSKLDLINAAVAAVKGSKLDQLLDDAAQHFGWQPAIAVPPTPELVLPAPQTNDQRRALQAVWDAFFVDNVWPTMRVIDNRLYRRWRLQLSDVADELAPGLLQPPQTRYLQDDYELTLSIAGATACDNSREDVALFLAAVRRAAHLWLSGPDDLRRIDFTAKDVLDLPELPAAGRQQLLTRLGQILGAEAGWGWNSYDRGDEARQGWSLSLGPRVRDLLDVTTVEAFWAITRPAHVNAPPLPEEDNGMPGRVFLVHGHDNVLYEVARFLDKLTGSDPIILDEQPSTGRTIIEKFEALGGAAGYAVVLLTSDDLGGSKNGGQPQPRARQNVVFELGFFCGRLGRERVSVLTQPEIEPPSDISGLVYISLGSTDWKVRLAKELRAAGVPVSFERAFQ